MSLMQARVLAGTPYLLFHKSPPKARTRLGGAGVASVQSHLPTATASVIPTSCATMNKATPLGAIPANVSDNERAIVTAGFANEVEAVNQYADVM